MPGHLVLENVAPTTGGPFAGRLRALDLVVLKCVLASPSTVQDLRVRFTLSHAQCAESIRNLSDLGLIREVSGQIVGDRRAAEVALYEARASIGL